MEDTNIKKSPNVTPISKKMWMLFIVFGLFGQIAWSAENMFFNLFIYDTILPSTTAVAIMVQASGIVATVATLLAGALSDKVGNRRYFISYGYIIWGFVTLSFAFVTPNNTASLFGIDKTLVTTLFGMTEKAYLLYSVLIVVVLDCVMTLFGSTANDAAFNAWVTDNTDKTNRGTAEGVLSILPLISTLLVAVGLFVKEFENGYTIIFCVLGSLVTLCGLLGVFTIKDAPKLVRNPDSNYFADIFYGFRPSVIKRNGKLYVALIAICIYSIACQVFMPYLMIYMEHYLGLEVLEYGAALGVMILIAAVATVLLGKLSDKVGREKIIFGAAAAFAVGLFALYFVQEDFMVNASKIEILVALGGVGCVMLLGYLMLLVLLNATVRDNTPERDAGKFQGIRMIFFVMIPMFAGPAIGDAVNKSMAQANPARFTYFDESIQATANIPAPQLFLWAAAIAILVVIPIVILVNMNMKGNLKKNYMKTTFAENIGDAPLQEYPRPQMERDSYVNLNGKWKYAIAPTAEGFSAWDGEILVPFSPETLLSGVQREVTPSDTLYYEREFELADGFVKATTLLHFGAVDYACKVKINDMDVGGHEGGYTPFTLDVSAAVKEGLNVIAVEVTDPSDTSYHARGKQRQGGHGIWYNPQSGIWQTVWMESVCEGYIKDFTIVPDIDNNTLTVKVVSSSEKVTAAAMDGDNTLATGEMVDGKIVLNLTDYELWSPENPKLYDLVLTAGDDVVKSYFGMRKFSTGLDANGKNRLMLNNKPYFHTGVLDQGYWSDGMLTPSSEAAIKYDLDLMKDSGFNMLRKHIKIEPLRWYYHCDRKGILVWQDMVNGGRNYNLLTIAVLPFIGALIKDNCYCMFGRQDKEGREEYMRDMYDTVGYLKNCVSLAVWVPFNEGWGQFDSIAVTEKLRAVDNTRTIDSVSGWHDQGKNSSECKSLHIYFRPVKMPKNEKRVVLLSEFGGYSMPTAEHMFTPDKIFGYKIFQSKEKLQAAYKKLFDEQVIPFLKEGLSASVYTQVSDVEEEINGFVTYDRKVEKFDREFLREINAKLKL